MSHRLSWTSGMICGMLMVAAGGPGFTQSVPQTPSAARVDQKTLQRKEQDQQRARELARKLIESTLQSQLDQLRENGLQEMPIYGDIETMRKNIGQLVDTEMSEVVELLAAAQEVKGAAREEHFLDARQRIRDVVAMLSVERHNLLRRLKTAEVAEQVRRLISLQNAALAQTRELPNEARIEREARALRLIEDERDVRELFLHLVEALGDVRTWGGPVAQGATDGLRVLKASETGSHLDQAVRTLGQAAFPEAAEHQQQVVFGLQRLLEVLARTQGLIDSEHADAQRKLEQLIQRQTELRDATRHSALNDAEIETLVARQQQMQRELVTVMEQLSETPEQQRLWDQAQQASQMASIKLFDAEKPAALDQQGRVLGSLSALLEMLKDTGPQDERDLSAEQYAARIRALEQVQAELQELRAHQTDVADAAEQDPEAAAEREREISARAAELSQADGLPEPTASSLQHASETTRSAADTLAKAAADDAVTDGAATDSAADADTVAAELNAAEAALEQAAAHVNEALADARRKAIAVRIGELARAAEALERAAAAEHEVARTTTAARKAGALEKTAQAEIESIQADVAGVARKTATGLNPLAPDAVAKLDSVADRSGQIAAAVGKLKPLPDSEPAASKPDLQTPPDAQASADGSVAALQQASEMAAQNAEELAAAAKQLRSLIQDSAADLVDVSREQLESVAAAREAVDAIPQEPLVQFTEQLARLQAARERTLQAAAAQERAAGRPHAARAMEQSQMIERAVEAQQQAAVAAERAASGASLTPLDAVTTQQAVAEQLEALAAARPDPGQSAPTSTSPQSTEDQFTEDQSTEDQSTENPPADGASAETGDAGASGAPPGADVAEDEGTAEAGSPSVERNLLPLVEAARREAEQAAQALLDRDYARAENARAAASHALREALRQAQRNVELARKETRAREPDASAQQRVTELAAAAGALAANVPAAAQALEQAASAAGQAVRGLTEAGSNAEAAAENVVQHQQAAAGSLAEADTALRQAIGALAGDMSAALAEVAVEVESATGRAAETHAGATTALQAAQQVVQPVVQQDAQQPTQQDAEPAASQQGTAPSQSKLPTQTPIRGTPASTTEELQDAVGRAAANLAAREQQIQRDRAIGQALAELAVRQQDSAEEIHAQRANLETLAEAAAEARPDQASATEPAKPGAETTPPETTPPVTDSPELRQALRDLSRAAAEFARSQQLTGEGAAEVSGQDEIANLPLRQALQQASRLPSFEPGSEMAAAGPADPTVEIPNEANAQAQNGQQVPDGQQPPQGQPSPNGQPGQNGQDGPSGQQGAGGESGGESDGESDGGQSPRDLGTGVIPQSPQVTANMMAGTQYGELIEAAGAAVAEAASEPAGEGGQPGTAPNTQGQPSTAPDATAGSADGGGARPGQETPNAQLAEGPLQEPPEGREPETTDSGARRGDVSLSAKRFQQQPWFAKLPPELRQALRSNATQRAPRAYEERLRRYFESIDTPE